MSFMSAEGSFAVRRASKWVCKCQKLLEVTFPRTRGELGAV